MPLCTYGWFQIAIAGIHWCQEDQLRGVNDEVKGEY
jgi:hypothetical protein